MSSYKPHAIAGIIFALPFVPSIFYLFFALIGASIPDMDHNANKNKVYSMFIIGVILSILLFIYNGSIISCLIIISLAIIFCLSKHRGFTHTFLGIIILSFLFMLMVMGFLPVFSKFSIDVGLNISSNVLLFIIMAIVGYFVVNRRYFIIYLLALAVYMVFIPLDYTQINWITIFCMLFLGALSHIVLDLWTPAGLKVFEPFSNIKFHKNMALFLIIIWGIISIYFLYSFNPFFNF